MKKREWETLLKEIKDACARLDIACRETSRIRSPGGLCSVKGRKVIILNRNLDVQEKVSIMVRELRGEDFSEIFLKPDVRSALEGPVQ